jgi:hypothetical protein
VIRRGLACSLLGRWCAIAFAVAAVGLYYLWQVRAAGYRFDWKHDQAGYYDYLGRAFATGHLELPIKPSAALLAVPNPWDPSVDDSFKMHDMALFNGRYYLYHGPGPAILLFAPWRLITGHDLPENFALFLLCFGGFVFSCGVLIQLLALADARIGPPLLALMLLALGLCQSVPYLLSRVWVYEIAIGGGYFCISAALFFLVLGIRSGGGTYSFVASGLMFGLAVACRPHLGLFGVPALTGLAIFLRRSRSRELAAMGSAFGLVLAGIAAYNYLRFGNPFEFGLRYLLAGPNQNRIRLASEYVLPGLYFWLACPPDLSPVFPWVRLAFRYPFDSPEYGFPPGYFIEPTVGAVWLAPLIAGALFVPFARRRTKSDATPDFGAVRILLVTVLASSAGILLFLAATGFTSQRYEVDFLPTAVLVAVAGLGILSGWSHGLKRVALAAFFAIAILWGAVANMALGVSGPYDEMLRNRPKSYLRTARWFSPMERFRPVMNPVVEVRFTAHFPDNPHSQREPLVTMGRQAHRYMLYAEGPAGKLRLVSRAENSTVVEEVQHRAGEPADIRVMYSPESGKMATMLDGREVLVHEVGTLVTAPADVTIGENRVESGLTAARFSGQIADVIKTVRPSR